MSDVSPPTSQAPSPKSRRFSEDFKRDSVRLVTDEQYSFKTATQAVGVSEKSLRDSPRATQRMNLCRGGCVRILDQLTICP